MEPEIAKRLDAIESKLEAVYHSIERLRKYGLWMLIITIAVMVLPLLGFFFVLPTFLASYGSLGGL